MKKSVFSSDEIEDLKSGGYTDEQIKSFGHFERIEWTLEDWLADKWQATGLERGGGGIAILESEQQFYSLSKIECQKIEQRKTEILEGFVKVYLDSLISWFEHRHGNSNEQDRLVRDELKTLNGLLFHPDWQETYSIFFSDLLLGSFDNRHPHNDKKFCYWYNRICKQGVWKAIDYIKPSHAKIVAKDLEHFAELNFVVAAVAFGRFKKFLEGRLKVVSMPSTSVLLRPAYVGLFVGEDAAHKALEAAMSAGIIDETGKSKLSLKRVIKPAIVQFWEAVSDRKFELTHIRAEKEAISETYLQQCKAVAEQFGATISPKTIYSRAGERAGKFFSAVSAALERQ